MIPHLRLSCRRAIRVVAADVPTFEIAAAWGRRSGQLSKSTPTLLPDSAE